MVFLQVARSCGLRSGPGKGGARLHDLRHTFAVRALERSAEYDGGIARHMTALSTVLGHTHVSDTYWYLQSTHHLMTDIANACEAFIREDGS